MQAKKKKEIYLSFSGITVKNQKTMPSDLFTKAEKKLNIWEKEGCKIKKVYQQEIEALWAHLKKHSIKLHDEAKFKTTVAAAAPVLKELNIEKNEQTDTAAIVSINTDAMTVKNWYSGHLRLNIQNFADSMNNNRKVCSGSVHSLYIEARSGGSIKLREVPFMPSHNSNESYTLKVNLQNLEIIAYIHNKAIIKLSKNRLKLQTSISEKIKELRGQVKLKFLENTFKIELKSAALDCSGSGLLLPISIVVAKGSANQKKSTTNYPGKGRLEIKVAQDQMSAEIINFQQKIYSDIPNLDSNWLELELARLKIKEPKADFLQRASSLITKKSSLNGLKILAGHEGNPPSEPILKEIERKQQLADGEMHQATQQLAIGEPFAKIIFKNKGEKGNNIFGEQVPTPLPQVAVSLEGAEEKEPGIFVATTTGLPEVDPEKMIARVIKTYVHKGNVDLASGNINFDGEVIIHGNIEAGSNVECTGRLRVKGSINGRHIKAKDIQCGGGVLLSAGGILECDNLKANFAENSKLKIKNDLILGEGLLNSHTIVGGNIDVLKAGSRVAGGVTYCWGTIRTMRLGYNNSNPTTIYLGTDYQTAYSLQIKMNRQTNLNNLLDKLNAEIDELNSRSKSQLRRKQKETLKIKQIQRVKVKRLVKKISNLVKKVQESVKYNDGSAVLVKESVSVSCQIYAGEEMIYLATEFADVRISFTKKAGHHVSSLIDPEANQNKKKEA